MVFSGLSQDHRIRGDRMIKVRACRCVPVQVVNQQGAGELYETRWS